MLYTFNGMWKIMALNKAVVEQKNTIRYLMNSIIFAKKDISTLKKYFNLYRRYIIQT